MCICCLRKKEGGEKRRGLGWEVFFFFFKGRKGEGEGGGRGEVIDYAQTKCRAKGG